MLKMLRADACVISAEAASAGRGYCASLGIGRYGSSWHVFASTGFRPQCNIFSIFSEHLLSSVTV